MDEIQVGKKKIPISKQAKITFWAWIVSLVCMVAMAFLGETSAMMVVQMGLFMAIAGLIAVYATNCMVVGQCNVYAWLLVAVFVLNTAVYVSAVLYMVLLGSKSFHTVPRVAKGKASRK